MKKQLLSLKNARKLLNVRRSESLIWSINMNFYLRSVFESYKFKEMLGENRVSKTCEIVKLSKT